jgi:hypothetical protein
MRFANPTLFLFVFFFFIVTCVVQREAAVAKERVVSGSSGSNSVTIVVSFYWILKLLLTLNISILIFSILCLSVITKLCLDKQLNNKHFFI